MYEFRGSETTLVCLIVVNLKLAYYLHDWHFHDVTFRTNRKISRFLLLKKTASDNK